MLNIPLRELTLRRTNSSKVALPVLSALRHYRYLKLPLIVMIFYKKIRFGYFEAVLHL